MEQKDIQFNKGIHRAPSMEAQEGELSECVNLIPKNGELVNVKVPEEIGNLGESEILMAIHETAEFKHFIVKDTNGNKLYYYDDGNFQKYSLIDEANTLKLIQVVPIGNALSLIYDRKKYSVGSGIEQFVPMRYLLWKNNGYIVLGELPDIKINFSLSGELYSKSYIGTFNIVDAADGGLQAYDTQVCSLSINDFPNVGDETYVGYSAAQLQEKGLVGGKYYRIESGTSATFWNRVIITTSEKTYIMKEGENRLFYYPSGSSIIIMFSTNIVKSSNFFFAIYKSATDIEPDHKVLNNDEEDFNAMMGDMKDYIRHVYKTKDSFIFPFFLRYGIKMFDGSVCHLSEPIFMLPNNGTVPFAIMSTRASNGNMNATLAAIIAKLNIQSITTDYSQWTNWEDIVTGVSIAITAPIYKFNQGEEYDKYTEHGEVKQKSESALSDNYGVLCSVGTTTNLTDKTNVYPLIANYSGNDIYFPPSFTDKQFNENIKNASVFYEVKTYNMSELRAITSQTEIDLSSIALETIETLPKISDDYNSAQKFYPAGGFAYNNRLNLFDVKSLPALPVSPASPILNTTNGEYRCIFYISNMDKTCVVKSDWIKGRMFTRWLYYGDVNTKKCRLCKRIPVKDASGAIISYINPSYADITMAPHPWLNGAYALIDDESSINWIAASPSDYDPEVITSNNLIYNSNAIYASNASNPFFFPVSGQNKIGTGKIKAVSTAAKALSEGQFGQFPLYAFTTDGIWALSVNEQGQYATSNPVNRDVVNEETNVCQIDDSVVYACSQGLKRLSGSESVLLSGAMDGENTDEKTFLGYTENSVYHGTMDDNHKNLSIVDTNTINNLLQKCKIMYDPANGRKLHIYPNELSEKHYIYDLESGEWTTYVGIESKVKTVIPGYPYSVIQTNNNQLMSYINDESDNTIRYGVLLTRAMEFGNPFVMKMLCDLKMIYTKKNADTKCQIAVFVSNDRVKWKQLTSLRKHSYKWYRFRIQTAMTDLDALTAVSCLIDTRRDNKLR